METVYQNSVRRERRMKDTVEEQSYGEVLISLESDGRPALKELGGSESPALGRRPRELP